jgi:TPR repeat protein
MLALTMLLAAAPADLAIVSTDAVVTQQALSPEQRARAVRERLDDLSPEEWLRDDTMFRAESEIAEGWEVADLERAAASGHARSQYLIARVYQFGNRRTVNAGKAVRWFRAALAQGEPRSMTEIGFRHEQGNDGLRQDIAEAIRLYRLAAAQGEVYALTNLGILYRDALGVERDYAEAMRLFRRAADAGHPQAMTHVGYLLSEGLGVAADQRAALPWFERASGRGEPFARYHLGRFLYDGLGGAEQDRERGLALIREAAGSDVPAAADWLRERGLSR